MKAGAESAPARKTAQTMGDNILTERIPIAGSPRWSPIGGPGLGVKVDDDKAAKYHAAYREHGEFPTYLRKVAAADGKPGPKRKSMAGMPAKRR